MAGAVAIAAGTILGVLGAALIGLLLALGGATVVSLGVTWMYVQMLLVEFAAAHRHIDLRWAPLWLLYPVAGSGAAVLAGNGPIAAPAFGITGGLASAVLIALAVNARTLSVPRIWRSRRGRQTWLTYMFLSSTIAAIACVLGASGMLRETAWLLGTALGALVLPLLSLPVSIFDGSDDGIQRRGRYTTARGARR